MILIVESGSTKSDWVLVEKQKEVGRYKTMGFNPFFHNETIIYNSIRQNTDLRKISVEVNQIFFYGAGCSSEELNLIVKKAFSRFFVNAEVTVDHDLLACALATYNGEPSISCILGTGSNSCLFDGTELSEAVPALGYILGDEGSASFIGKRLVSDFLYKRLPSELAVDFYETYGLDKDEIITSVYNKPNANVYLASFSRFAGKHMAHPYIKMIVREGFEKFADIHIGCFHNATEVPVHFVGSVGAIFHETLEEVLIERGFRMGQIMRKPVDGLIKYHLDYLNILNAYQV